MFKGTGAKILDGSPNYFVIEDIGQVSTINQFEKLLHDLYGYVQMKDIQSVKIVLNEREASNNEYLNLMDDYNFLKHDTQCFYKRDLNSVDASELVPSIDFKSIEQASDDLFKNVWQKVVTESLNAPPSLSIEKEFEGMKTELGPNYIKNCLIAYHEKVPIGITIPHIEPGTIDEGRLFYFGLVPEYRGKKWGWHSTNFPCNF
ncbi:hypothetical protein [Bacillus sp. Marseille-Q3570]|uniref:hypothetical protein n=1 Tax=Bacillus sp. Marseille-Q3570 TaxID=2963522 RepID=UPI0021B840E4|nr:hypothetical protein [Bacillus sp. Marseille-Q3570]